MKIKFENDNEKLLFSKILEGVYSNEQFTFTERMIVKEILFDINKI